jgi:hypothetical protein
MCYRRGLAPGCVYSHAMTRSCSTLIAVLLPLAACAHGDPAPTTAPTAAPAAAPAAPATTTAALGPFTMKVPIDWQPKAITSKMRAADYALPAAAGDEAELVIYYFGDQGAGTIDDNVQRWLGQFTQPDGKPTRDVAKIEATKIAGQDATLVTASGHFVASAMPGGGEAVDKLDQSLLAAIIASPSGPYYFKLVGARKTIDANAARFHAMLDSLVLR